MWPHWIPRFRTLRAALLSLLAFAVYEVLGLYQVVPADARVALNILTGVVILLLSDLITRRFGKSFRAWITPRGALGRKLTRADGTTAEFAPELGEQGSASRPWMAVLFVAIVVAIAALFQRG